MKTSQSSGLQDVQQALAANQQRTEQITAELGTITQEMSAADAKLEQLKAELLLRKAELLRPAGGGALELVACERAWEAAELGRPACRGVRVPGARGQAACEPWALTLSLGPSSPCRPLAPLGPLARTLGRRSPGPLSPWALALGAGLACLPSWSDACRVAGLAGFVVLVVGPGE